MAEWSRIVVTLPPPEDGQPARSITLRALWARETEAVEDMFPRPVPPTRHDPRRGSLSDPIADEFNPGYQQELRRWLRKTQRVQLALAMEDKPRSPIVVEDLNRIGDALADRFTSDELGYLWTRLRELSMRSMVKQALSVVIISRDGEAPGQADPDGIKVPESYDLTEDGIMYRAACRAGQDPHTWPASLSPEQRAKTIAHEIVMRREETERMEALRAIAGILA